MVILMKKNYNVQALLVALLFIAVIVIFIFANKASKVFDAHNPIKSAFTF